MKNIYSLHDESGRITQSNKVFDDVDGNYGRILANRELKFINHSGETYANLNTDFVMNGEKRSRPRPAIAIDKTLVKAGGNDVATITNIPEGSNIGISVLVGGAARPIQNFPFDGPDIEFPAPVPGLYIVTITKWPYRDWERTIEAYE